MDNAARLLITPQSAGDHSHHHAGRPGRTQGQGRLVGGAAGGQHIIGQQHGRSGRNRSRADREDSLLIFPSFDRAQPGLRCGPAGLDQRPGLPTATQPLGPRLAQNGGGIVGPKDRLPGIVGDGDDQVGSQLLQLGCVPSPDQISEPDQQLLGSPLFRIQHGRLDLPLVTSQPQNCCEGKLLPVAVAAAVGRDEKGTDGSTASLTPRRSVCAKLVATGRAKRPVGIQIQLGGQLLSAQPARGGIQKLQPVLTPATQPFPPAAPRERSLIGGGTRLGIGRRGRGFNHDRRLGGSSVVCVRAPLPEFTAALRCHGTDHPELLSFPHAPVGCLGRLGVGVEDQASRRVRSAGNPFGGATAGVPPVCWAWPADGPPSSSPGG